LHKYAYAHNNPIANVDPSGHFIREMNTVNFIMQGLARLILPSVVAADFWGHLGYHLGTVCIPLGKIHLDPDVTMDYSKGKYGCGEMGCWRTMPMKADVYNGVACAFIQEMKGTEALKDGRKCKMTMDKHLWGQRVEREMDFSDYVVDSYTKNPFYLEKGKVENPVDPYGPDVDYQHISIITQEPVNQPILSHSSIKTSDQPSVQFGSCNDPNDFGTDRFSRSLSVDMDFRMGLYDRLGSYSIDAYGELVADPPLRGEVYEWPFKFETDIYGDLTSSDPPNN
jgi:hypothetical protein